VVGGRHTAAKAPVRNTLGFWGYKAEALSVCSLLFLRLTPSVTRSCSTTAIPSHFTPNPGAAALTRMGQYVSLQLVRPVELLIAARVTSATTTNAGKQHESAEDRCIHRSWTIKRSTTLLLSSTQMGPAVQSQQELHCFSPAGEGQEISRLLQGCVASARLHMVRVSL